MSAFLPLVPMEKEIYAREYLIPAECFECNEAVTLHAECTQTSERDRNNGYYMLTFHFSVGDYGVRQHLVGVFFGRERMSREAIDQTIDDFARSQINDIFPQLVADYLEKEEVWEEKWAERELEGNDGGPVDEDEE